MRKIDFELLFNRLLDDMFELYDLNELCAKMIDNGLDDEQLLYLGFELENIENGKKIVSQWYGNA